MKNITVTIDVRDTATGERLRSQRTFSEFYFKDSKMPDFVAVETQDQLNDLIKVMNKEN